MPDIPGAPPSPELAAGLSEASGEVVHVDECAQMEFYRDEVLDFWADEPGEKAKLAGQAVVMLWNPSERAGDSANEDTGFSSIGRTWIEPAYVWALYLLAIGGALLAGRRFVVLAFALLGYQTLAAMVFVGTPRYRAPWDFLLAVLAGVALVHLWERRRR